jgi:AraC-like DNA-binding protein
MRAGLPKPYVELVISLSGVHWWRSAPASEEHRYDIGWVTPVQTSARYARAVGIRRLVGARLEPWVAQAWLGPLPIGDGSPPPHLASLLGSEARRLHRDLRTVPEGNVLAAFSDWLALQPALREACARTAAIRPTGTVVGHMAERTNVKPRSLRRTFGRRSGVAPKRWLLLHRLDGVLRDERLADPDFPLAQLAADHGFSDQAHLCRDFRRFTGASPKAFRRRDPTMPSHMLATE